MVTNIRRLCRFHVGDGVFTSLSVRAASSERVPRQPLLCLLRQGLPIPWFLTLAGILEGSTYTNVVGDVQLHQDTIRYLPIPVGSDVDTAEQ